MIKTRTSFALVAASALLLLTGCSGGGDSNAKEADTNDTAGTSEASSSAQASSAPAPAGDQSKADACQIVQEQFQAVSQAGSSIDTSDPQATLTQFRELATQVDTEFGGITNEEVAPAAQKASGALNEYATFLEGLIADPNTASGLSDQVTALQESFTDAATVCTG